MRFLLQTFFWFWFLSLLLVQLILAEAQSNHTLVETKNSPCELRHGINERTTRPKRKCRKTEHWEKRPNYLWCSICSYMACIFHTICKNFYHSVKRMCWVFFCVTFTKGAVLCWYERAKGIKGGRERETDLFSSVLWSTISFFSRLNLC